MPKIKEKRRQTLYFYTTPKELRELANHLEKIEAKLVTTEATFFLNDDEEEFMDSICIRFIKSEK